MFNHEDAKMEISEADYLKIRLDYPREFGNRIKGKIFVTKRDIEKIKARGFDLNQICIDQLSSTEKEFFVELGDYKIQDYFSNPYACPLKIDFKTMMEITLVKDATTFDHRGSPVEKKYTIDGIEVAKRTWEITYFNVPTIMTVLGVNEATANLMADDLIWTRKENFHFMLKDGTYSTHVKPFFDNFVPFNNGIPDLKKFYKHRKSERVNSRDTILTNLEPEIVEFIKDGASVDLETARITGITFLMTHDALFRSWVKSGDETIFDTVKNEVNFPFLDYDTSLNNVDCRMWIVNSLKQLADLTTAI